MEISKENLDWFYNEVLRLLDENEKLRKQSNINKDVESLSKKIKSAELAIKLYKGEADLYRDLYRSAHEAYVKELYGTHGTLANLLSLK